MDTYTITVDINLSADIMREIGAYTHIGQDGQRVLLSRDAMQFGHMAGAIRTIPAQVHPGTGLSYASEDPQYGERIEVNPGVADWFGSDGELLDEYEDGISLHNALSWPE